MDLNLELIDETYNDIGKKYIETSSTKNKLLTRSPNSPFVLHVK